MEVLVGIPTHKRPELLRKCLESIEAQEGELPDIRVFVADNDPTGREGDAVVAEVAPSFRFPLSSTVVEEPGISAVRNAIVAEANARGSDFIAMIDDDETASRRWLTELLEAQVRYGADVVGGPVHFDLQGDRSSEGMFWTDRRPSGPTGALFATNNNLISSAALRRLDWPQFDQQFGLTGGGDLEWFTRIGKLGASFAWNADALVSEVVPRGRRNLNWFLKRQFRVGENQIRVARLHGTRKDVAKLVVEGVATLVASPVRAVVVRGPAKRNELLRHFARSVGRFAGLLGVRYREYAVQHTSDAGAQALPQRSD